MDMNLKSMNNVYHKTSSGVSKMSAKFNVADTKNTISVSEQKSDKADKVSISPVATQQYEIYKMTKSVMKDIDAVDMNQKVEDIKTKIENNTYQVSPDKIADKILSRWTL
ncbi:MAG: flagellar biosynthesis anti-sigma factor FlgM [Oscillospiraceae bacterium]